MAEGKKPSGSARSNSQKPWKHFEAMSFLRSVSTSRKYITFYTCVQLYFTYFIANILYHTLFYSSISNLTTQSIESNNLSENSLDSNEQRESNEGRLIVIHLIYNLLTDRMYYRKCLRINEQVL